jgi:hypothetical protein
MADEVQAGQDPPTNPPVAQAGPDPPQQSSNNPQQPPVETFDRAYVQDLRGKLKTAEEKARELDKIKAAQLTEQERIKQEADQAVARATQAEARARALELQNHLLVKATEYGIKQNAVGLVLKALDQSSLYSEDGTLDSKALKEAISTILKDVPELAVTVQAPEQPSSNASPTNAARPVNSRVNSEPVDLTKPPGWGAVFNRPKQ